MHALDRTITRREFIEVGLKGMVALGLGPALLSACQAQSVPSPADLESITLWRAINEFRSWKKGLAQIPFSQKLTQVAQAHVKDINSYHPEENCLFDEGGKKKKDGHAWSVQSGSPHGCYSGTEDKNGNPVSPNADLMSKKPTALVGYKEGAAFEIACVSGTAMPYDDEHSAVDEALHCWTGWVWGYNKKELDAQGNQVLRRVVVKDYATAATSYGGYLKYLGNQGSQAHADVILQEGQWAATKWLALGTAVGGKFACAWFGTEPD